MVSLDSWVVVAPDCLSAGVSGETVILELNDGRYYGLDPLGTRIWSLLQERRQVREIHEDVLAVYDVSAERCEADLIALLSDMAANGLIVVADDSPEQS